MFNPEYEHPMEIFSWPHLLALGIIFSIILVVFFSRKFFMKHKWADRTFRYTLVGLLLFFELVPYFKDGPRSLFGIVIGSYPLCGMILWFSVVAFASDSERFVKLFYPFAIIGAMLSLIVLDMDCTFPHLRAFQFFFTHGCFLIGVLYFVFTRKISRYTLNDLGKSCAFLFSLSLFNLIIAKASGNVNDPYFVLTPPGDLMFFKDALGQVGYTIAYLVLITGVMFAIYGITYLCTKHRPYEDLVSTNIKKNPVFDWFTKLSNKTIYLWFFVNYGLGTYLTVLAEMLNSNFLKIMNVIVFFVMIISLILNELLVKYKKQYAVKEEINEVVLNGQEEMDFEESQNGI